MVEMGSDVGWCADGIEQFESFAHEVRGFGQLGTLHWSPEH